MRHTSESHGCLCDPCDERMWRHEVLETLHEIRDLLRQPYSLQFWVVDPITNKRSKIEMAFTLTDIQQVTLAITVVDARGNPAALDGAPVWTSSDAALLTVVPSTDGLSCVCTAVGPLGAAQVTVTGDALIGDGVRELFGVLDIDIVASEALNITIVPGVPV